MQNVGVAGSILKLGTAAESVGFSIKFTRNMTDPEIETGKNFGPAKLTSGKILPSGKMKKISMI